MEKAQDQNTDSVHTLVFSIFCLKFHFLFSWASALFCCKASLFELRVIYTKNLPVLHMSFLWSSLCLFAFQSLSATLLFSCSNLNRNQSWSRKKTRIFKNEISKKQLSDEKSPRGKVEEYALSAGSLLLWEARSIGVPAPSVLWGEGGGRSHFLHGKKMAWVARRIKRHIKWTIKKLFY